MFLVRSLICSLWRLLSSRPEYHTLIVLTHMGLSLGACHVSPDALDNPWTAQQPPPAFSPAEISHTGPRAPLVTWASPLGGEQIVVADQILVTFRWTATAEQRQGLETWLALGGHKVVGVLPRLGVLHVQLQPESSMTEVLEELRRLPGILTTSANTLNRATGQTQPPSGTGEVEGDYWMASISAYDAWDLSTGSPYVAIGVVDTYLDASSVHLSGKVLHVFTSEQLPNSEGACLQDPLDPQGNCNHGLGVSSLATSRGDDGLLSAGAAWHCPLIFVDAAQEPSAGGVLLADLLAASELALLGEQTTGDAVGAKILTLTVTPVSSCGSSNEPCLIATQQALRSSLLPIVQLASNLGALIVTSAGNDGVKVDDNLFSISDPEGEDLWRRTVLNVAATDSLNATWTASREGAVIDLAAPGTEVTWTLSDGSFSLGSGTSFASGIVAGAAGVVWGALGHDDAERVKGILLETAQAPTASRNVGAGILDMGRATLQASIESGTLPEGVAASEVATSVIGGERQGDRSAIVSVIGDLNGDGLAEFLIGSPDAPAGSADEGRGIVYLFDGQQALAGQMDVTLASATFIGQRPGDHLGVGASAVGDVDGDGIEDFAIVAGGDPNTSSWSPGYVALMLGAQQARWVGQVELPKGASSFIFGTQDRPLHAGTVTGGVDLNDDGMGEILIGAPVANVQSSQDGGVFVLLGRATWGAPLPLNSASLILRGEQPGAAVGASLSIGGDIDQDGSTDILIGSPGYDGPSPETGRVYLLSKGQLAGRLGILDLQEARYKFDGWERSQGLGSSLAAAGDLDQDGFADFMIGAPNTDGYSVDTGALLLFLGASHMSWGRQTSALYADASFYGTAAQDRLGAAMSGIREKASDFVGIVAGAPGRGGSSGAAYFIAEPLTAECRFGVDVGEVGFEVSGPHTGSRLGSSVATYPRGDTITILLGAPGAAVGSLAEAGIVYTFAGPLDTLVANWTEATGQSCSQHGSTSTVSTNLLLVAILLRRLRQHRRHLALLGVGLLMSGCQRGGPEGATDGQCEAKPIALDGVVLDELGKPRSGVSVFLDTRPIAVSEEDGHFTVTVSQPQSSRIHMSLQEVGRAPYWKDIPTSGCPERLSVTLLSLPFTGDFKLDPSLGGVIDDGLVRITLPALTQGFAGRAQSQAQLSASVLSYAPGGGLPPTQHLHTRHTDEEAEGDALLQTFGMVGVWLTLNGQPVSLDSGSTATIEIRGASRFSHPETLEPFEVGDKMPLYHLPDQAERWELTDPNGWIVEPSTDGSGLSFFARVTHFSYWNVDVFVPATCLGGDIFTRWNDRTEVHSDVLVSSRGYTSAGGEWHTWVYSDARGHYCQKAGADTPSAEVWFDKTFEGVQYKVVTYVGTPAITPEPRCGDAACTEFDHEIPCGWFGPAEK